MTIPPNINYRELLLQLCGSLTLADHLGDVHETIDYALARAGINDDEIKAISDLGELGTYLGKRYGVRTLHGTDLYDEGDHVD